MTPAEPFTSRSQRLGRLQIVNFLLDRMGLTEQLQTYLPSDDPRLRLAPATVIAAVVRNIVAEHRPVYALGEWAAPYDPALLGLVPGEVELLNDDRAGRTLDRLFDCDRASLITQTVLGVIREFNIDTTQLHNDSTTITVTGNYPDADGRARGGKPCRPPFRHGGAHVRRRRPPAGRATRSGDRPRRDTPARPTRPVRPAQPRSRLPARRARPRRVAHPLRRPRPRTNGPAPARRPAED